MRAAIYARKSNDDSDKSAGDKSVERQAAHARDFISQRGWTLDDNLIFVDDNVSGAEFKNRPGLLKLLDHLRDFDVIVCSEQSRFGREMTETSAVLAKIASRKVKVFFYLTGQELRFATAADKFMVSAVAFANELERELASQRAHDAALKRAKEGRNFGGRVYGYDNIHRLPDRTEIEAAPGAKKPIDAQTIYRINPTEAEVVRGIFRACADGRGLTAIAKALNGDPAYSGIAERYFDGQRPAPPRKGTGSWAPSSVREILHRERYRGRVPFGRYRKVVRDGSSRARELQPEYLLIEKPELRVVDEDLWHRTQTRLRAVRADNTAAASRPRESRYLLSGLMRCEQCGAAMIATSMTIGTPRTRRKVPLYACSYASSRGQTVCTNTLRPRMRELDEAVIEMMHDQALNPAVARRLIDLTLEEARAEHRARPDRHDTQQRELARLRTELDRLIDLVVGGRAPDRVRAEIQAREERVRELERATAAARSAPEAWDWKRIESAIFARTAQLREVLRAAPSEARPVLAQLLARPMAFRPLGGREYELRGETRAGILLTTASEEAEKMASPRGFEPLLPP